MRPALAGDEVLICDPFRLEALYSARDAKDYMSLSEELDAMAQAPCDHIVWQLAQDAEHAGLSFASRWLAKRGALA